MSVTPELARCKGCGMPMAWGKTEKGAAIPLSPVRLVYALIDGKAQPLPIAFQGQLYVSHFETCPDAGKFSKKEKP